MAATSFPTYWFQPRVLMAGQYPGGHTPAQAREKIRWLLSQGVRRFVDLTEAGEITWRGEPLLPYADLLDEEAKAGGVSVEHQRFGIRDMDVPPVGRMRSVLNYLDEAVSAGQPAYVHCLGGKGRTGTVVACYLLRHAGKVLSEGGEERLAERALRRVVSLREDQGVPDPWDSPQTPVQFRFVRRWEERQTHRSAPDGCPPAALDP